MAPSPFSEFTAAITASKRVESGRKAGAAELSSVSVPRSSGSRVPLARLKAARKAAADAKALADATREHLKRVSTTTASSAFMLEEKVEDIGMFWLPIASHRFGAFRKAGPLKFVFRSRSYQRSCTTGEDLFGGVAMLEERAVGESERQSRGIDEQNKSGTLSRYRQHAMATVTDDEMKAEKIKGAFDAESAARKAKQRIQERMRKLRRKRVHTASDIRILNTLTRPRRLMINEYGVSQDAVGSADGEQKAGRSDGGDWTSSSSEQSSPRARASVLAPAEKAAGALPRSIAVARERYHKELERIYGSTDGGPRKKKSSSPRLRRSGGEGSDDRGGSYDVTFRENDGHVPLARLKAAERAQGVSDGTNYEDDLQRKWDGNGNGAFDKRFRSGALARMFSQKQARALMEAQRVLQ